MLAHIVVWKYKDEVSQETREAHRTKLANLKNAIPEIVELRVGADMLHLPRSYDTGLIAIFKNLEDLNAYTVHPVHKEAANLGKKIAAHVASIDFVQ